MHYTQPMASMLVDGKLWELRFDADGAYHWEAEGVTQEEKDAAMVDISSLAQSPSPSMDPSEASFADQVPQSLRIKLRDQVVTHAPDPALLEALAKRNEKPHLQHEEDKSEGQKVFHPGAAKAMKLRQATLCDPIEPPQVDPAKIEEAVTLTTEVLGEMQSGALSVADKEALGAKVLRQLDMEHYKECLLRSYLDGPRGQHPARSNQHRKSQGAELGTTGPWTEDGGRPPPHPRTTVLLVRSSQSSIRAECLRPGV